MPDSDEQLIDRVRASDAHAFQLLFEKYQPLLFRNILYSTRNTDTAHDVVQETFLRVWNHRSSLRPDRPLLAYLFRISNNLVRDHAKHREVRRRLEGDVPLPTLSMGDDPEQALHVTMLQEKLSDVVRTMLPTKCREIFLLSRLEGLSNGEISARLGVSVKTVENQITRALTILRRQLQGYRQK
ncbi:MAG: RNA polymerase sigma-70 factor [Ignavibacteriae bacterium]|nr:RNA polymerase sigma-70 factor [Ignavibacteriota bacterium]